MSVSSLADPAIRNLYGIADARDVQALHKKVADLTEIVSSLQKEVELLRNVKDTSSVKITQNASAGTNKCKSPLQQ